MDAFATLPRLEPAGATEAADLLRQADGRGQAVLVRGHGTKARWGVPPVRTDVVLSLAAVREPVEHCAGDLTVTVPAGATLSEVNARLAREGQWLPLDPWAGAACSIGGLVATNDSGPRRHRHGAPRDLVIGVEFALADGRLVKAGGRVVKNVAGYDIGRLLCGSFGSLAVITGVTFKLAPLPPASRTVVVSLPSYAAASQVLQAIGTSPLTPSAVDIAAPRPRVLVRFETTEASAEQQAAAVVTLAAAHGAGAEILAGGREAECWEHHHASVTPPSGALLRVGALPGQVPEVLAALDQQSAAAGVQWQVTGRALMGALMIHLAGGPSAVTGVVAALRRHLAAASGHASILAADPGLVGELPRWADPGPAASLMRAVKAQFDPRGTLCPGGGPGGVA